MKECERERVNEGARERERERERHTGREKREWERIFDTERYIE